MHETLAWDYVALHWRWCLSKGTSRTYRANVAVAMAVKIAASSAAAASLEVSLVVASNFLLIMVASLMLLKDQSECV